MHEKKIFTPPFSMGRHDGRGGRSFRPGRKNGFRDKKGKGNTYRERSQGNFGKRGGKARVAISRYVLEYQKSNMHVPTRDHQSTTTVNGHVSDFNSSSCRPNVDDREHTTNQRNANQEIKPDRVESSFASKSLPTEDMSEEQQDMLKMFGFAGFGTTKGRAVVDNQHGPAKGGARIEKGPRKYRQYMNRLGKNRLLDKDNTGSQSSKII